MRDVEVIEGLCDRFILVGEARGLQKQKFAESVGLTPSQLTNISRYRNPPPHAALQRASELYGVTTDYFYTGVIGGFRDEQMAERLRELTARKE